MVAIFLQCFECYAKKGVEPALSQGPRCAHCIALRMQFAECAARVLLGATRFSNVSPHSAIRFIGMYMLITYELTKDM